MIAGELVTDLDLLALDSGVLEDFGDSSRALAQKRQVAVSDWLRPRLQSLGLNPMRHHSRRQADAIFSFRSNTLTDIKSTSHIGDKSLSSLLAVPATDCLYVGMLEPFRGVFVGMTDTVNAQACVSSLTYWSGRWNSPSSLVDGTSTSTLSFASGGCLNWSQPDDWFPRSLGNTICYWVRLQASASLTPATQFQSILPLTRSRLTDPVANYTLHLLYREGIAGQRGEWLEKAKMFYDAATMGLERVLPLIADEFDTDGDTIVERVEVNSVAPDPGNWTWERG